MRIGIVKVNTDKAILASFVWTLRLGTSSGSRKAADGDSDVLTPGQTPRSDPDAVFRPFVSGSVVGVSA